MTLTAMMALDVAMMHVHNLFYRNIRLLCFALYSIRPLSYCNPHLVSTLCPKSNSNGSFL